MTRGPLTSAPDQAVVEQDADPIRVLRIITTLEPEVGGPSYSAVSAAVAEQSFGASTTIISTRPHGTEHPEHDALRRSGVSSITRPRVRWRPELGQRWALSPSFVWWIVRNVRRYDVVHVHYVWPAGALAGVMAARLSGIPVVLTPHESLTEFDINHSRTTFRRRQKRIVRRMVLGGVDRVIVASELERRGSGLSQDRAVVIPHAVPEAPARQRVRDSTEPLVVGYLGRLHRKKRVDLLLRAIGATCCHARLVIAGNQPSGALRALRSEAASLDLTDRTEFVGFVDQADRNQFFEGIDVLVMPSAFECFGMAAAEGLAAGVPTIVTENTGIGEIIRAHGGGTVVRHDSVSEIADALDRLDADADVVAQQSIAARRAARHALSYERYGAAVSEIYRSVLRRPRLRVAR